MRRVLFAMAWLLLAAGPHADAASLVTYSWVVESGLGDIPTTATFQVELAKVQAGTIQLSDIQNIQLGFPGIGPLLFTAASSVGMDNAAFVDVATGLPTFSSVNQGLAVIGYEGFLFSDTFLAITFGLPEGGGVGDTYNAIDGGPGSLGSGRGRWTISGYAAVQPVPEPSAIVLAALGGIGVIGAGRLRSRA